VRFTPGKGLAEPKDIVLPSGAGEIDILSFAPSGVLWGTGPGALYHFDGKEWKTITSRDGLRGQTVTSLVAMNDDEVWIGYNDVVGVSHLHLAKNGIARFEHSNWDWTVVLRDSQGRVADLLAQATDAGYLAGMVLDELFRLAECHAGNLQRADFRNPHGAIAADGGFLMPGNLVGTANER
jgi:ligand-binding sensor domain-containing protein